MSGSVKTIIITNSYLEDSVRRRKRLGLEQLNVDLYCRHTELSK